MPLEFEELPHPGIVSIIIPCYNSERFLTETLESALAQTYTHTEIIVIDDGSTDRTAELIHRYTDRARVELGPNRGASAARNRGTVLARGEFIQYLDADDLLTADAVARRVAALQRAGADIAYSDWGRLVEIEPNVFKVGQQMVRRIEDVHPNLQIALITSFWAPPAAVTYRRSVVEKIGGWKEWLPIIQDARFLQDAGLVGGKFVHVPGIGAKYREHFGPSLSRSSHAAFISDVFRNACDLQQLFMRRGAMTAEERQALAQIFGYASRSLFFCDKAAFRECVERLYEVEPAFRPTWPKTAGLLSNWFGFKVAGVLVATLQRLRSMARRSMRKLQLE
jgi:hypothetical protein